MPNKKKLHIAMFPWLAFGHMIPYLELAKLMAQKGHHISFLSTPQNIDRLPKLPPNLASLIDLVKLPYHTWKRTTSQKMPRPPLMSHITKSHTSRKHMMLFKTPWLSSYKIHTQTGFFTTLFLTGYLLQLVNLVSLIRIKIVLPHTEA